jgi:hypothetical protein
VLVPGLGTAGRLRVVEQGAMSWTLLLVIIGVLVLGTYFLGPQLKYLLPAGLQ